MWAAVVRYLSPVATWFAKVFLLPLLMDFIAKMKQAREEKIKRDKAHKEIEDGIKKIEEAVTPEDQEAALEDLARKARARRSNS